VESIRELLTRQFSSAIKAGDPNVALEDAVYTLLRSVDVGVTVDGWTVFRIVNESHDHLAGVGLMTLLPDGTAPISVTVRIQPAGIAWQAQVGLRTDAWLAMSDSKRWNSVYLHASGDLDDVPWEWGVPREGILPGV